MKLRYIFLLLTGFSLYCGNRLPEKVGQYALALRQSDGQLISLEDADDYNPIIIRKSTGHLVLLFASDRSGTHNVYVTESVEPYLASGPYPLFKPVKVFQELSGSALNYAKRVAFSATIEEEDLRIAVTKQSTNAQENQSVLVHKLPLAAIENPIATQVSTMQFKGDMKVVILNGTTKNLFYADETKKLMQFQIVGSTSVPAKKATLAKEVQSKGALTFLPGAITGGPGGNQLAYFFTNFNEDGTEGGLLFGALDQQVLGDISGLNQALTDAELGISYANAYFSSEEPLVNGLVFSAGTEYNAKQDLYAVTSHKLPQLWAQLFQREGRFFDAALSVSPDEISGIVGWYSAESFLFGSTPPSNGAAATDWENTVNPDMPAVASGSAPYFYINEISNKPAVGFTGSQYFTIQQSVKVGTVFLILESTLTSNSFGSPSGILGSKNGSGVEFITSSSSTQTTLLNPIPGIFRMMNAPHNDFKPIHLPKVVTFVPNSPETVSQLYIGKSDLAGSGWQGNVAEVIIYDRALTLQEQDSVIAYLGFKYQLPPMFPTDIPGYFSWNSASVIFSVSNGLAVSSSWIGVAGNSTMNAAGTGATYLQNGFFGGSASLEFAGTQAFYASSIDPINTAPTGEFTAIALFEPSNVGGGEQVVFSNKYYTGTYSGFTIAINSSAKIVGEAGTGTGAWPGASIVSNNTIANNLPIIVAFSKTSSNYELDINGMPAGATPGAATASSSAGLYVGKDPSASSFFNGKILDVITFSRGLNAFERNAVQCFLAQKYMLNIVPTCGPIAPPQPPQ